MSERNTTFDLRAGFPIAEAYQCNLLEENEERLDVSAEQSERCGRGPIKS